MMMMMMMMMSILTSTISASCSFYSYIAHLPSPSPSFIISLYIIYIGVKKEDSFSAYARNDQNQGNANTKILQRLEKACWQGVEATIREKDLREKKASMYFQKHMSAVSLTLPTSLSGTRQSGKPSLKDSSATTLTKHMYDLGRCVTPCSLYSLEILCEIDNDEYTNFAVSL